MDALHPVNVIFMGVLLLTDLEVLELVISMDAQEMVNAVLMDALLMMGIMETVISTDVQQMVFVTSMAVPRKIAMILTKILTEAPVIYTDVQVMENVPSMGALPPTGLEDQEAVTFMGVRETANAISMAVHLMMDIMVNVTDMAVQLTVHVTDMDAPKYYK